MNDRMEQRRRYDAQRRQSQPWRAWYKTPAWKARVRDQRAQHPTCCLCDAEGVDRLMAIVDHHPPHNGDWHAFFHGPVRSLCKQHHDSQAQADEARGFSVAVADDGWPTDPNHPANTGGPAPRHRNKRNSPCSARPK